MRTRITKAELTSNAIIERDELGRFIREIERSGSNIIDQLGNKLETRARRYAPYRTGRLKRSIKAVVLSNGREVRITSSVPYALVMEEGSRPHLIHGVRANFEWRGGYFVWNNPKYGPMGSAEGTMDEGRYENWDRHGATVRHPGTRGYFFFRRAFRETMADASVVMARTYPRR